MVRTFTGKFFNALVLVLVLTMAVPWAAFAEGIAADGDNLSAGSNISLTSGCTYPVTVSGKLTITWDSSDKDGSKNVLHYAGGESLIVTAVVPDGVTSAATESKSIPANWGDSGDANKSLNIPISTTITKNVSATTVTYTVTGNTSGFSKSASFTVTTSCAAAAPTQATTTLAASPAIGVFGGTTTLSATLSAGTSGVDGKTISFKMNGVDAGTATTNANGVATRSNVSLSGLNAGSYTVSASFAGDNTHKTSSDDDTLTVSKVDQAISFGALSNKTYGDAAVSLSATATSGLSVSFGKVSGECTVTGSSVSIDGAGSCTVRASQAGNNNYNAAPNVDQTFTIARATAGIELSGLNQTYDGSYKTVDATTTPANLPVTVTYDGAATAPVSAGSYAVLATVDTTNYTGREAGTLVISKAGAVLTWDAGTLNPTYNGSARSAGVNTNPSGLTGVSVTYDSSAAAPTNAGTYAIKATLDNANYEATPITGTLVIAKANQTISFDELNNKTYGDADFAVSATASSALSVSFAAAGNCTVSNGTVTITGAGSCTITASQAGNGNYLAATDVERTITIEKAQATIELSNLTHTYNGTAKAATATTNPANLTGVSVTYDGSATVPTNAGSYAVVATLDNANYQAQDALGTLVINKAPQAISFGALGAKTYGDAAFAVSGSASSGLDVSFEGTGPCSVSGSTVSITGAGTCGITASQAGNDNYLAADSVPQYFQINQAILTVSGVDTSAVYGDAPSFVASYNGFVYGETKAVLGGTLGFGSTFDASAAASRGLGQYEFTPQGHTSSNYAIQYAAGQLTVTQRSVTVKPADISITYGDTIPAFHLQRASGSLGYNDTLASLGTPQFATNPANPGDAGTYTISVTSGLNNGNYDIAIQAGTLSIAKAAQTITFPAIANQIVGGADVALGAMASSGLPVGYTATDNCSIVDGKVRFTGVGSCTVTASQEGNNNYLAALSVSQTFKVTYRWDGFLQPINDTAHMVSPDYSVFKAGSTIPVKFQLKDVNGNVVQAASTPEWIGYTKGATTTLAVDESTYTLTAMSGNLYKWDATSQQYIYNWSTKGLQAGYFYKIGVRLADGTTHTVTIGLR